MAFRFGHMTAGPLPAAATVSVTATATAGHVEHEAFGGRPAIRQHGAEGKPALAHPFEHAGPMLQPGLAVPAGSADASAARPEATAAGVPTEAGNQADAVDDLVLMAAPLALGHPDAGAELLVRRRAVKKQAGIPVRFQAAPPRILPQQSRRQALPARRIAADGAVAPALEMVSQDWSACSSLGSTTGIGHNPVW